MKVKVWMGLGVLLVTVASILVHLPASLVLKWVPVPKSVQLERVSGTVWQGQMERLSVSGVDLGKVVWRMEPWNLLKGQVQTSVRFGQNSSIQLRGKGRATLTMSGLSLEQTTLSLPAQNLEPWIQAPLPIALNGLVSMSVREYHFDGGLFCQQLNGQISWQQASINVMSTPLDLDVVNATLKCRNRAVVAESVQSSESLDSQFSLTVSAPNRYQVNGWFTPNSAFPAPFRQQLSWLPKPDANNHYSLKQSGRW